MKSGDEEPDGDTFTRWITVEDVGRNQKAFPNVIDPGGLYDPNTKKIIACIMWNDGTLHEMKLETYVYNYND